MKRFLIKVFIIGIIIVATFATMELYVRSIPNEYSYKSNYLDEHIDSIQILALGSSIGRSGIDPEAFDGFAFNAANVSQDLETDCAILDKYFSRAKKLETVIFTLLPGSYCSRMGEGIEYWRLRKYDLYMDLNIEKPSLFDRFEISEPNKAMMQIIKGVRGTNTIGCFEKGMGRDTVVESEAVKLSQGVKISKIHNEGYQPNNYAIIISRLKENVKKCDSAGIQVFLVLMPSYHTYYERIDKKMLEECDSISKDFASVFSNVSYYNLFKDSTYTTEDFRNSNHLSPKGAKKLSLQLNEIIK